MIILIERLRGFMHENVTPNKCDATCKQFAAARRDFLGGKVPQNRGSLGTSVTANFRGINPTDFLVLT